MERRLKIKKINDLQPWQREYLSQQSGWLICGICGVKGPAYEVVPQLPPSKEALATWTPLAKCQRCLQLGAMESMT